MKRILVTLIAIAILMAGCASKSTPAAQETGAGLLVSGATQKTYMRADLEKLPVTQATFAGVQYKGVAVSALLKDAGFDPQSVKAVKAVANDGFTVNYDPSQFLREDFIVAYTRADGDLTADDGDFRIVMPDAEGKLNPRMLVELQIIQ